MISWKEYYAHFYDWEERDQVRNLYSVSSLGPVEEVAEIINSLSYNIGASDRLLKKAVEAKLSFGIYDLLSFSDWGNDKYLISEAALNSINKLSCEDVKDLYGLIEEDVFVKICRLKRIDLTYIKLPEETSSYEEDYDNYDDYDYYEPEEERVGFFWMLLGFFLGLSHGFRDKRHKDY